MFSSPSPTKVIIIIASGKEPVTRHYSKVESHPAGRLLVDKKEAENRQEMLKMVSIQTQMAEVEEVG